MRSRCWTRSTVAAASPRRRWNSTTCRPRSRTRCAGSRTTLDVLLFDRAGTARRFTPAGRDCSSRAVTCSPAAADVEQRVRRVATGWEIGAARSRSTRSIPLARVFPLVAALLCRLRGERAMPTRNCGSGARCWAARGTRWPKDVRPRARCCRRSAGRAADTAPRAHGRGHEVFVVAPTAPVGERAEPLAEPVDPASTAPSSPRTVRAVCRLAPSACSPVSHADRRGPDGQARRPGRRIRTAVRPVLPARRRRRHGRPARRARLGNVRPPSRAQLAWRSAKPGKALAWWIDAATRADWRHHLAAAPAPPQAPVTRGRRRA